MRSRILLITMLVACSARAATYLVGTDRDLIRASEAIVVATAGESNSIRSPRAVIETATRMHIEDVIAGPLHAGEDVDVVEIGGVVDHTGLAVAGSPRFTPGERLLLLLNVNRDGAWTTTAMALGRFTFARDVAGRELLVREEGEIVGWEKDGAPHRERRRGANSFRRFVRDTAKGGDPLPDYFVPTEPLLKSANAIDADSAAASTYLIQQGGRGIRWSSFPAPVTFLVNGTQPGTSDGGIGAAQRSVACWTSAPGANIQYRIGGTTSSTKGLNRADGTNSIVFNDPTDFIGGSFPGSGDSANVLAVGGAWFDTSRTHTFNGETFYTISEADLVVQNGINTSFAAPGLTGLGFDHVVAHELGHTLGFRHSDDGSTGGTTTSEALMNSTVDFNHDTLGASLLGWDIEAADAVYGSGSTPPPCVPPSITTQPQSTEYHNTDVALTVTATGTAPLSYQWYAGSKGDIRVAAPNGTNPTLVISSLNTTTSYWVRVTGQCSPPADSEAATITVNGCPAIAISSITSDTNVIQGRPQTLSASASSSGHPLTYQWFAGARGDMTQPAGTGASITITPPATNTYWVLVSNDCGATATSSAITITVIPCTAPGVVIQPASAEAINGNRATLAATISGTAPMQLQWYEGHRGDTTHPVANANTSSFTTDTLFAPTSFWLSASNPCGDVQTNAAAVTIVPTCTKPVITAQPQNGAVLAGTSAILTVGVSGPSLSYAWYQGPVFDFTHPTGGSAPSLATPPITAPTEFWVRISNPCGQVNSIAATVTPIAKRRSVRR